MDAVTDPMKPPPTGEGSGEAAPCPRCGSENPRKRNPVSAGLASWIPCDHGFHVEIGGPVSDEAIRIATIIEAASEVYTREGVGLWLLGRNGLLDNRRPVDLIREGQLERLEAAIDAMASGAFV